jgi:dihydrofolate reductase
MKLLLMMAQSVDGIIARHNRHFPDWTCPADKQLFKRVTTDAGVLIMGSRTYATIGKPLPDRLNVVYTRHPELLPQGDNVRFTMLEPRVLLSQLEAEGYERAVLTGGSAINSFFAKSHIIDEIFVTIAPRIFGRGLTMFDDSVDFELELLDCSKLDAHTLLLHYRVLKEGTRATDCMVSRIPNDLTESLP